MSTALLVAGDGEHVPVSWYSPDPVPLDRLVTPPDRLRHLRRLLAQDTPVAKRISIAARWYAAAHWADQSVDAILASGIALDALVGDPSGLPTRSLSERFALLEPDPMRREERARRFREIYQARSAVVHGAKGDLMQSTEEVRAIAAEVRWASQRLLALDEVFAPRSHDALRHVFEQLRWGTELADDHHRALRSLMSASSPRNAQTFSTRMRSLLAASRGSTIYQRSIRRCGATGSAFALPAGPVGVRGSGRCPVEGTTPLQHPNLWLLIAGPTIRLSPRHAKVRRGGYRR